MSCGQKEVMVPAGLLLPWDISPPSTAPTEPKPSSGEGYRISIMTYCWPLDLKKRISKTMAKKSHLTSRRILRVSPWDIKWLLHPLRVKISLGLMGTQQLHGFVPVVYVAVCKEHSSLSCFACS